MFVRKKKNPSGVVSVQVIDKSRGRYVVRKTIGSSNDVFQIEQLVSKAHQWIKDQTGQEILDFTNYEELTRTVLDQVSGITISGVELLLGRIFDQIGLAGLTRNCLSPWFCPGLKARRVS